MKIVKLNDAEGNGIYPVGHSDAIKIKDQSQTLTAKLVEIDTKTNVSVNSSTGVTIGSISNPQLVIDKDTNNDQVYLRFTKGNDTYSVVIPSLRVDGNELQYSNDGQQWNPIQTFGTFGIKYVGSTDPSTGTWALGDLILVGSNSSYELKVYDGNGTWQPLGSINTPSLDAAHIVYDDTNTQFGDNTNTVQKAIEKLSTTDGIKVAGGNNTLTNVLEDYVVREEENDVVYPSTKVSGVIPQGGKWVSKSSRWSYMIPHTYRKGDIMIITANSSQPASWAFLTSDSHVAGDDVDFANEATGWTSVAKNTTAHVEIPSTCTFILIYEKWDATSVLPSSLKIKTNIPNLEGVEEDIEDIRAGMGEFDAALLDIDGSLYESEGVDSSEWIQGTVKGGISNGVYPQWVSWDFPYFVPIGYAKKVLVTTGAYQGHVAFVTSTEMSVGGAVPFAEGETSPYSLASNKTHILNVPSGAKYLFCAQKIAENWAFPTSVVCKRTAFTGVEKLQDETDAEYAELQSVKQDRVFYADLSDGSFVLGKDVTSGWTAANRVSLVMQRCYKGDIIKTVVNSATSAQYKDKIHISTYNKDKVALVSEYWTTQYEIQEDGYYSVALESAAGTATTQFLLDNLVQITSIETVVKNYVGGKWERDEERIAKNRVLLNNSSVVNMFDGISPIANTFRQSYIKRVVNSDGGDKNQSIAFCNGYFFFIGKGGAMSIYDSFFRPVGNIAILESRLEVECNASYFSNEYVEETDEFPILYCETIYALPSIIGFRIIHQGDSWSLQRVHDINLDVETGNAIVIYDKEHDDLLYGRGGGLQRYHRPLYANAVNGVSTISYENDLVSFVPFKSNDLWQVAPDLGQDKAVYGNIVVSISYNRSPTDEHAAHPANYLFGLDMTTGEVVFTYHIPGLEGEGLEWYCGRLYMLNVNGYLYEFIFNGGTRPSLISGPVRPSLTKAGFCFFDTTLGKPIWYTGSGWVDANGQNV